MHREENGKERKKERERELERGENRKCRQERETNIIIKLVPLPWLLYDAVECELGVNGRKRKEGMKSERERE